VTEPTLSRARLLTGPRLEDRIFFHGSWAHGHHNPRYRQLLPRLDRLDSFLIPVSANRVIGAAQRRFLRATKAARYALVYSAASRRYRWMFTTDLRQITYFKGPVVADFDDPSFTPRQVELLEQPNLAAYVVTTEGARSRFEQLGVTTPAHVISQGADLASFSAEDAEAVAARHRRPDELVVGYIAAWLFAGRGDGAGSHSLFGIDHLLELWDGIRRRVRDSRLWLIGATNKAARSRLEGRDDVLVLDRIPQRKVLSYIANFDIALYPRRVEHAPMPVKLAEYVALGVPTVSYDLELAQVLRETGAGSLAGTPEEFVENVARLASDETERNRLAAAGKAAAPRFDWNTLARRYQEEVLDRYLR
jgi:glycosyltransferase involved in cell wall biosynthesis